MAGASAGEADYVAERSCYCPLAEGLRCAAKGDSVSDGFGRGKLGKLVVASNGKR